MGEAQLQIESISGLVFQLPVTERAYFCPCEEAQTGMSALPVEGSNHFFAAP
jgi:hypothetical protein